MRLVKGLKRNERGNVAGLMPHPERAADRLLGSGDGLPILRSLVAAASQAERSAAGAAPSQRVALTAASR